MPGPGAFLVGEEERREVEEILQSGYLSRYGRLENPDFKRKVATLEEMFAGFIGVKHCLALNGGTSAIMASLAALGIQPGSEIIVPGYTYIATMSAVIAVGGGTGDLDSLREANLKARMIDVAERTGGVAIRSTQRVAERAGRARRRQLFHSDQQRDTANRGTGRGHHPCTARRMAIRQGTWGRRLSLDYSMTVE